MRISNGRRRLQQLQLLAMRAGSRGADEQVVRGVNTWRPAHWRAQSQLGSLARDPSQLQRPVPATASLRRHTNKADDSLSRVFRSCPQPSAVIGGIVQPCCRFLLCCMDAWRLGQHGHMLSFMTAAAWLAAVYSMILAKFERAFSAGFRSPLCSFCKD